MRLGQQLDAAAELLRQYEDVDTSTTDPAEIREIAQIMRQCARLLDKLAGYLETGKDRGDISCQ